MKTFDEKNKKEQKKSYLSVILNKYVIVMEDSENRYATYVNQCQKAS